jgi:hypothetical protein
MDYEEINSYDQNDQKNGGKDPSEQIFGEQNVHQLHLLQEWATPQKQGGPGGLSLVKPGFGEVVYANFSNQLVRHVLHVLLVDKVNGDFSDWIERQSCASISWTSK